VKNENYFVCLARPKEAHGNVHQIFFSCPEKIDVKIVNANSNSQLTRRITYDVVKTADLN
jgi:hypothetical protein